MRPITLKPIGVIYTPYQSREGMPIQPSAGMDVQGHIDLYPEFQDGLQDLDGFSHIILIYHLHRTHEFTLSVKPFLDHEQRGVFATRAPRRPNPIGLSVVVLEKIEKNRLHIRNIDMLDRTPLLDIKPYVPDFDSAENVKIGWLSKYIDQAKDKKSDTRFT